MPQVFPMMYTCYPEQSCSFYQPIVNRDIGVGYNSQSQSWHPREPKSEEDLLQAIGQNQYPGD
jgi:hypothetical protein